jgi:hypothetical protein
MKEMNKLTPINTLLHAIKTKQLKRWFYEFRYGHPFLISEEAEIIIKTRIHDRQNHWMHDEEIKTLVKLRVKEMYAQKFPNAKSWSFPLFNVNT